MGKLPDFTKKEKNKEKDMDFSTLTDGKALRAKRMAGRGRFPGKSLRNK